MIPLVEIGWGVAMIALPIVYNSLSERSTPVSLRCPSIVLDCRNVDQSSDGMLENRTVPAIYNDTNGECDQQYDETGRLVPAQTNRHF